jgi:hypothetical protein
MNTLQTNFDKVAIGFSALCLVHCLLLPVAVVLLPTVGLLSFLSDEIFHLAMVALVLPVSAVALTLGCKQHRDWLVIGLGVLGLSVLVLTAVFAHDYLGKELEVVFTVVGALIVAACHIQNYRLCQAIDCVH